MLMTMTATDNLETARRYLEALETGAHGDALAEFFTKDVVQEEFPNRLSPIGVHRNLNAILDAARKGRKVIRAQKFEIMNSIADGDRVALEVFWSGFTPSRSIPCPPMRRSARTSRCGLSSRTGRSAGSTTMIASTRGGYEPQDSRAEHPPRPARLIAGSQAV